MGQTFSLAPGNSSDLILASGIGCGWACDLSCPLRVFPGKCEGTVCKEVFSSHGLLSWEDMYGDACGLYVGITRVRVRLTWKTAEQGNRGRDSQGILPPLLRDSQGIHCSGTWIKPSL